MAKLVISPPFSLTADDWKKIAIGGVISVLGALATYIGIEVLPSLKTHVASDTGLLIYTLLASAAPVLLNIARKFISDTSTVVKMIVIAVGLSVFSCGSASAAEFTGATAAVLEGTWIQTLLNDPLTLSAIVAGICLLCSKVFKIDLSAILPAILNSLLKPPSTTPAVPAVTPAPVTPVAPVVPTAPLAPLVAPSIQILLDMLLKARASGDTAHEQAALKLLDQFRA